MKFDLVRRLVAEGLATAMLLTAVVGSGIMAERLSAGNNAVALLANAIATGCALFALIAAFGPISGANLNPVVTLAAVFGKYISPRDAAAYVIAQISGALAGVAAANAMFELPVVFGSTKVRTGTAQWFSEFVATFGLIAIIAGVSRVNSIFGTAGAVAAYIAAAYWFTASTSFANPAVTIARTMSNTFAGIRPIDAPAFIAAQIFGAAAAMILFRWLLPTPDSIISDE